MTAITVKVAAKSKEFRVSFDGGVKYYMSEDNANATAESIARSGVPCELETRGAAGQMWRLKYTYTPLKGGRVRRNDPYNSGTGIAFDDQSLQGRIAT